MLIVDDNAAIHDDIIKILRPSAGTGRDFDALDSLLFGPPEERTTEPPIRIDSAFQGEAALGLVAEAVDRGDPYAVVFVDVRMPPGLDGVETLERLWRLDPNIHAVICTAYADQTWEEMVASLGRRDGLIVLKKPFDVIEIKQVVHALADAWQRSREERLRVAGLEAMISVRSRELSQVNGLLQREVAQRRAAQLSLTRAITHDHATGLPNEQLAGDRLARSLDRARRSGRGVAALLVSPDARPGVWDSLGHAAAGTTLRIIAQQLRGALRNVDTLARVGEQLLVVLDDLDDPAEAGHAAHRIVSACRRPVELGDQLARLPVRVGVALFPSDAGGADGVMSCASIALQEAQTSGREIAFFAPEMETAARGRIALRGELDQALERAELELFYQPLVELGSERPVALEALVRWRHPTRGLLGPGVFIPEAERSGQITALGAWVLDAACAQLAEWRRSGFGDLVVAVNVSGRQLQDPGFAGVVVDALARYGLPAESLELEITETAAIGDRVEALHVLDELADRGVSLVIDDFGAGYSSLARLHAMPLSGVKIDRFFVQGVDSNPRSAAIVVAITAMAAALGLRVVAEGVETEAELAFLRGLGQRGSSGVCHLAQGFLFSRPVPAGDATRLLESGRARPVVTARWQRPRGPSR